jgi:hypothetical protein
MITGKYLEYSGYLQCPNARARPAAKSQVDNISFATHQKFKHPLIAWEAYESARLSNLVHKLPYHPPLVQAAGPPNIPPNPPSQPSNPSTRTRRQRQEPEVWVPVEDQDQPGLRSAPKNPAPAMWAGTWPSRPPTTLSLNLQSSPDSSRQQLQSTPQHTRIQADPSSTSSTARQNRAPTSTAHLRVAHTTSTASSSFLRSSKGPPSSQSVSRSVSLARQTVPSQWIADVDDPWHGLAKSFVVFQGTVPGICTRWYGVRLCNKNTILNSL